MDIHIENKLGVDLRKDGLESKPYQWVKEDSLVRAANAALLIKKFDDVLACVATLGSPPPVSFPAP